jgi:cell division protein ZipA
MICFAFIYIYVLIIIRIYDKDHPGPFQLNQSGKVSGLLDSTRLTFPEYDTTLKELGYKANRETEWVIDLYRLDNTAITEKTLEKLFDEEWEDIYPSYLYGFSNTEKKWILIYAADSTDTFDSLQVGVSLLNTYNGKDPNFNPALLDNYVNALNTRIAHGPAKLQLLTKESSATAAQRAKALVSIHTKFNKEASISLQTKKGFRGKEVWQVLHRAGLNWNADYLFEWTNNSATGESNHFTVETSTDPGYFSEELNEKGMRPKNLIFKFSIPISVDPEHVFDIMVHTAMYCQSELGGELVNIYMQPLDTVAERNSISTLVKQLKQQGVIPGSEKALSIF